MIFPLNYRLAYQQPQIFIKNTVLQQKRNLSTSLDIKHAWIGPIRTLVAELTCYVNWQAANGLWMLTYRAIPLSSSLILLLNMELQFGLTEPGDENHFYCSSLLIFSPQPTNKIANIYEPTNYTKPKNREQLCIRQNWWRVLCAGMRVGETSFQVLKIPMQHLLWVTHFGCLALVSNIDCRY